MHMTLKDKASDGLAFSARVTMQGEARNKPQRACASGDVLCLKIDRGKSACVLSPVYFSMQCQSHKD